MPDVASCWPASLFFLVLLISSLGFFACGGGGASQLGGGGGSTTPTLPSVNYKPPVSMSSAGTHSASVVVADFNGDGKPDIAVSNFDSNTIAVFLNTGGGPSASPIINTIQIPNGLGVIVPGDFNEDGKLDLIASTISGPQIDLVLLGNGDGTFTQSAPIPNTPGFLRGRVADLNSDKHLDFIGCGNGNLQLALGNGDGTFQPAVFLPNGPFPTTYFGCDVGDFNGDKKLDILAGDFRTTDLVLFQGNGDGTFQMPVTISSVNSDPVSISAADFNGDGKLDALVGFNAGGPTLFAGNGDGGFSMPTGLTTVNGVSGTTVLAADLNNDGIPDALVADFTGGKFAIELSPGLPKQEKGYNFSLDPGLSDIAVGDLNGDGLPDVVLANNQTNQIVIFLSQK